MVCDRRERRACARGRQGPRESGLCPKRGPRPEARKGGHHTAGGRSNAARRSRHGEGKSAIAAHGQGGARAEGLGEGRAAAERERTAAIGSAGARGTGRRRRRCEGFWVVLRSARRWRSVYGRRAAGVTPRTA